MSQQIILTPNQKILLDFFAEMLEIKSNPRYGRRLECLYGILAERLNAFWTPADYYFNDHGANGRWSETDYYDEIKNLEQLGLLIRGQGSETPNFQLIQPKEITVQTPKNVDASISRYELRILKRLRVETEPPVLVKYSENNVVKADYEPLPTWKSTETPINRVVQLGHVSLRRSRFAGTPDTYVLTPLQKDRVIRIPLKKWGGLRGTHKPKGIVKVGRPRKWRNDAERLKAYRQRKRTETLYQENKNPTNNMSRF